MRLYSSIHCATRRRAAALVSNVSSERSSNSSVECHDSMTALSSAEPGRPIDWAMPRRAQAARNIPAVYSLPWSVCSTTPPTYPPRTATAIANDP